MMKRIGKGLSRRGPLSGFAGTQTNPLSERALPRGGTGSHNNPSDSSPSANTATTSTVSGRRVK